MAVVKRGLLCALFACSLVAAQSAKPIPVILDTDIGDDIDDALALALILQSPELDLKAVTTVLGDTETRSRLVLKELKLYGRGEVPIGTGAPEPLLDPWPKVKAPQFQVLTAADELPPGARRNGAQLIVETLMTSPVKMTMLPVGPLTNIALALRLEPRIKEKIERIVLMGGSFFPPRAEYNIVRDRVAAEIVFESGLPIVAVGLDVTEKCKLQGADLERMRAAKNPASQFLVRLIELWQSDKPGAYPTLHDPLAIGAAVKAELIESRTGTVHVETASPLTYGTTVFKAGTGATQAARDVRVREFLELFLSRLSSAPRGR